MNHDLLKKLNLNIDSALNTLPLKKGGARMVRQSFWILQSNGRTSYNNIRIKRHIERGDRRDAASYDANYNRVTVDFEYLGTDLARGVHKDVMTKDGAGQPVNWVLHISRHPFNRQFDSECACSSVG